MTDENSVTVPDYQRIMLPLLRFAAQNGGEVSIREAVDALAEIFCLTEAHLKEMLPSGKQPTFNNRVAWAAAYMKKAGLLAATRRGFFQVTDRGRELLSQQPQAITVQLLKQYPEFVEFYQPGNVQDTAASTLRDDDAGLSAATPLEALEEAYERIYSELAGELLARLKKASPSFFERTVVELLVRMGYGGSRADAGKAVGGSGDGGIDGIIKEDKLGLDVVYIQAKRWDSTPVGRPDVMQFAGALQAQRAGKGIFITTSRFTEDAQRYVAQIKSRIVLIDGMHLARLMIGHDVGVSTVSQYAVKRVDNDYFEESV
ncbi:MAG: restriction endonuclease [Desulfobulbus sp.]|nr:restriction endonuclease [Desulfobulbus sp.]